jgi:hypothetical protein
MWRILAPALIGSAAACVIVIGLSFRSTGDAAKTVRADGIEATGFPIDFPIEPVAPKTDQTPAMYRLNIRWQTRNAKWIFGTVEISDEYKTKILQQLDKAWRFKLRVDRVEIKYLPLKRLLFFDPTDFVVVIVDDERSFGHGCPEPLVSPCARKLMISEEN